MVRQAAVVSRAGGIPTWRCLSWDWGLAYQQPTRARVSRVYVLDVGQSLYGFQSHQLPSVRDRVCVSDLWYLRDLSELIRVLSSAP